MSSAEVLRPRSARLVKILLEKDRPVSVDSLARQFSVSPRTIRYDLASVKRWVSPRGMTLSVEPRLGIRLIGPREKVLRDLGEAQKPSYQTPLLVTERRKAILFALLQTSQSLSLTVLADRLFVSRSTVKSDVAVLKRELALRGVNLRHRPGVGHYVEGDEAAIRKLMAALVSEKADDAVEVAQWATLAPGPSAIAQEKIDSIWQVAGSFRIETRLCLDPACFTRFAIMLVISAARASLGYKVAMPAERLAKLSETKEHAAVASLADRLKETCGVTLPRGDVGFLTAFLMEAGQTFEVDVAEPGDRAAAGRHAVALIGSIEEKLGLELSADEELLSGLRAHMQRVLRLFKLGIAVPNPLLPDIRRQYSEIYQVCLEAERIVAADTGMPFSEDEAGYLCMHIGAALERKNRKPTRALVCTNGVSSAKLLSARLLKSFRDIEIAGVVPVSQVAQSSGLDRVDLVISTVPFRASRDIVVVNPLLNEEDLKSLEGKGLLRTRQTEMAETSRYELLDQVMRSVTRYAEVKDLVALRESVAEVLKLRGAAAGEILPEGYGIDLALASSRISQRFKKEFPSMFKGVSYRDMDSRAAVAIERASMGGDLLLGGDAERRYPEALKLSARLLDEIEENSGVRFPREAPAFLAECMMSPGDAPVSIVKVCLAVSRDLGLGSRDSGLLERMLLAAYEGAKEGGITLRNDVQVDLALHLASIVIMREEATVLVEVAFRAASELTPAMIRAGRAMARRISEVLGRPVESWEEAYLALYAGASILRAEQRSPEAE